MVFSSAVLLSCTANYELWNTDPDAALKVSKTGFITTMQMDVIPTSDVGANEFERAQSLTGDIFSGYVAAIDPGFNSSNTTYNLNFDKWNDVGFTIALTKVMPAWLKLKDYHDKGEVTDVAFSVAQIIKVLAMHRIADNYGPIPYIDFGLGKGNNYDSQRDVYFKFFEELDAAIAILEDFNSKNPTAKPLANVDLIYGGDLNKWFRFANSLKLRLAMRLSYVDPVSSQKYAKEAIASGVLIDNNDNATLKTGLGVTVYNPSVVVWKDYADVRMGASIESFMSGYKDGRLGKYFQKAADGNYHGMRNGVNITSDGDYLDLSCPNIFAADPVIWMTSAEVKLLQAEAALRGWGGDAQSLYESAIALSFAQWSASGADSYIADGVSIPIDFVDASKRPGVNNVPARTKITVKWDEASAFETKLERIITQKWLAIYPEGQEAWSEFRRTGYPKIFPVKVNNSGGVINTDVQIRRVVYPTTEYSSNKVALQKGIALLGGLDNGGTKVWWDKK